MHISRSGPAIAAGLLMAFSASSAQAAAPTGTGNCVSHFASVLGPAGVAGTVISGGAHDLAPFGQNAVSPEAHASLGSCPFNPEDFLP
jgi:hypothetical protein